jgi:hypothetical protein
MEEESRESSGFAPGRNFKIEFLGNPRVARRTSLGSTRQDVPQTPTGLISGRAGRSGAAGSRSGRPVERIERHKAVHGKRFYALHRRQEILDQRARIPLLLILAWAAKPPSSREPVLSLNARPPGVKERVVPQHAFLFCIAPRLADRR